MTSIKQMYRSPLANRYISFDEVIITWCITARAADVALEMAVLPDLHDLLADLLADASHATLATRPLFSSFDSQAPRFGFSSALQGRWL